MRPCPELYDLGRDPFEERNIHAERPTVAAAMKRRLSQIAGGPSVSDTLSQTDALSPEAASACTRSDTSDRSPWLRRTQSGIG